MKVRQGKVKCFPDSYCAFPVIADTYSGCWNGCQYCMPKGTKVLLDGFNQKNIEDIKVGDELISVEEFPSESRRKFIKGIVTNVFVRKSDVYRIETTRGDIVVTGEHPFLINNRWRSIEETYKNNQRVRPIKVGESLYKIGDLLDNNENTEYKRGYIAGVIDGDGTMNIYKDKREGREESNIYSFRVAVKDYEIIDTVKKYLLDFGIKVDEFVFKSNSGDLSAIRVADKKRWEEIKELISSPSGYSRDFSIGYLAGMFDTEGSFSSGILKIANCNENIKERLFNLLDYLGFASVIEKMGVRIKGGIPHVSRFFSLSNPKVLRKKQDIFNTHIRSCLKAEILAIQKEDEVDVYNVETSTGTFIAEGFITHNCYARFAHDRDKSNVNKFDTIEGVDPNSIIKSILSVKDRDDEIYHLRSKNQLVVRIGVISDPFPRIEPEARLTYALLQQLNALKIPFFVTTKNPSLITEEYEKEFKKNKGVIKVSFSTFDDNLARKIEVGSDLPSLRKEKCIEFLKKGIPVVVRLSPLMKGITDDEHFEGHLKDFAEAGLKRINADWLRISATWNNEPKMKRFWEGLGVSDPKKYWSEVYLKGEKFSTEGAYHYYAYDVEVLRNHFIELASRIRKYGIGVGICNGELGVNLMEFQDGTFCCQANDVQYADSIITEYFKDRFKSKLIKELDGIPRNTRQIDLWLNSNFLHRDLCKR